ncbi:MAG: ATP synthase F0 subunit B, partial [Clostridiales bacterium]|nr:ATP synthase F0 subunit B [Clostridiales bacterium]
KPAEFIPALIAFLIIWIVLAKLVWPQVLQMMDKRQQKIQDDLDAAAKSKQEAAEQAKGYEDKLVEAHREAEAIIAKAKKEAEEERSHVLAKAQREAAVIIAKAHGAVDSERHKAMIELSGSVVDLSVEIATKIIGNDLSEAEQRKLAELQMRACRDAHIGRRRGRSVRRLRVQPFEEVGVALRHRSGGSVGDAVVGVGKGVFARVQAGVVPDGVDAVHAVERECGALTGLERAKALRVARRAEPRERDDGIYRRQHRDADAAAARGVPGDHAARRPRQLQKQRQRQRNGRRGQDDPKCRHAPFLPSPERWMLAFVGWSIL